MTYGLNVQTSSGEILISDTYPVPHFLAKGTTTLSASSVIGGNTVYDYNSTATVPVSGSTCIVFITVPGNSSSSVWYSFSPAIKNAVGTTVGHQFYVIVPTGTSYNLPTIYFFTLSNHRTASGYGLQVMNPSSTVVYDSRIGPLNFAGGVNSAGTPTYPDSGEQGWVFSPPSAYSMSKVGLLLPYYYSERHIRFGSTYFYIQGAIRNNNNPGTNSASYNTSQQTIYDDGGSDSGTSYRNDYTENNGTFGFADVSVFD